MFIIMPCPLRMVGALSVDGRRLSIRLYAPSLTRNPQVENWRA